MEAKRTAALDDERLQRLEEQKRAAAVVAERRLAEAEAEARRAEQEAAAEAAKVAALEKEASKVPEVKKGLEDLHKQKAAKADLFQQTATAAEKGAAAAAVAASRNVPALRRCLGPPSLAVCARTTHPISRTPARSRSLVGRSGAPRWRLLPGAAPR